MGGVYTYRRQVLGDQGGQCEKQAVQSLGHTVGDEEGHGGADERGSPYRMVFGRRSVLSNPGISDEG